LKEVDVTVYMPNILVTEPVDMAVLKDPALMATVNWGQFLADNNKDAVYLLDSYIHFVLFLIISDTPSLLTL
jgi:hypothetical protein